MIEKFATEYTCDMCGKKESSWNDLPYGWAQGQIILDFGGGQRTPMFEICKDCVAYNSNDENKKEAHSNIIKKFFTALKE